MEEFTYRGLRIVIKRGDITEEDVDAIVNAANSLMIMGGGVAGAIKRKGGQIIEDEARRYAPVPVGEAVATGAGKLRARYVIHVPTMEKPAMKISVENVRRAARAALKEAIKLGIKSVAFPALGAGVGGVPVREAIFTILEEIGRLEDTGNLVEIRLIAWSKEDYREFLRAVKGYLNDDSPRV